MKKFNWAIPVVILLVALMAEYFVGDLFPWSEESRVNSLEHRVAVCWNKKELTIANQLVKDYISANESKTKNEAVIQHMYLLYSQTFALLKSYKEATEVLKYAIDKYDGGTWEPLLVDYYKEYSEKLAKP
jgi:hypothetical protein